MILNIILRVFHNWDHHNWPVLQFNNELKSSHVMNFSLGILINAYVFIVFKKLEMNWIFSLIPMCSLSLHFILKHNIDYKQDKNIIKNII